MKKYLLVLLAIGLLISACAPQAAGASITGSWKLVSYGSVNSLTPAVPNVDARLTFDKDGKLSGNGGCNSLGGDYKVKGDQITFGAVAATLMACPDPQMAEESAVYQVLTDTASFKIEGNMLTITNKGMMLVLEATAGN